MKDGNSSSAIHDQKIMEIEKSEKCGKTQRNKNTYLKRIKIENRRKQEI